MAYCNTTSDLVEVFPKIFTLFERRVLGEDWALASGQTNTYQQEGLGYVEMVYDDGEQLTSQTSIANVESNAGSFYDDTDANVLYVHTKGSDDLTSSPPTIQIGEDVDAILTKHQNSAMEEMDAYLSHKFFTPLLPRLIKVHSSNDYETIIRRTCAMIICRDVVRQRDPGNSLADEFDMTAIGTDEQPGYLKKIINGDINLQDQITEAEIGGVGLIVPNSSNTSTAYVQILPKISKYTGSTYQVWRLQIDTAGTPGTATYKLSYDTGSNWNKTLQKTFDANNDSRRINIGSGINVVFWGTFGEGDYWDLHLHPQTDEQTISKIGSVELVR